MPTLGPAGPGEPAQPHQQRHVAESFGLDAERYDRSRPRYPEAFLNLLLAEIPTPAPSILDVGCGTGIVARQLQALDCQVLGIEPDARMAAFAQDTGVTVEIAAFETWRADSRRFDAVIAGQTWHWIDPVLGAAAAARALRPAGLFSVFWNVEQPPAQLAAAFAETYRRAVPDSIHARYLEGQVDNPDPYAPLREKAITGLREAGGFAEPREHHVSWQHTYTRDTWLDQLPTHGGHAQLSEQAMTSILAGISGAIDTAGGEFTMHCTTTSVTASRLEGQDSKFRGGSGFRDR